MLLLRVDDPDRARDLRHIADSAEGLLELLLLTAKDEQLLLREPRSCDVVEVDDLKLLHALKALEDRREVGEHAAEPALVDVGHPDPGRLVGDCLLALLLGADEHDRAAMSDGLLDVLVRLIDVGERLLEVDDVDAIALGDDEALHLRVPATGLMSEVDTAFKQLAHCDDGHGVDSFKARRLAGARRFVGIWPVDRCP